MNKLTIKLKHILFATFSIIIVSTILTIFNYQLNMKTTVDRLTPDSEQTINSWSKDLTIDDIQKIIDTHDEEIQRQTIEHFDYLAEFQPQVAQGYIFGVELVDGTGTSIVSGPSFLMHDFKQSDLGIGDIYTQPQVIADAIKDMKETKKQTNSTIYTDDYGTWITVLKPLFNDEGEMFAYYGVDFDAGFYLDIEQNKIISTLFITMFLISIVCILQYLFITRLYRPLSDIRHAMRKTEVADFTVRLHESPDEFGQLAKQFNMMSSTMSSLLESIKENSIASSKQATQLNLEMQQAYQLKEDVYQSSADFEISLQKLDRLTQQCLASMEKLSLNEEKQIPSHSLEKTLSNKSIGEFKILQELLAELQVTTLENVENMDRLKTNQAQQLISFEQLVESTQIMNDIVTELEVLIYNIKN